MSEFSPEELKEAHRALLSTLGKCEKMDREKLGKSQRTLLKRRIAALGLTGDADKGQNRPLGSAQHTLSVWGSTEGTF
jgi:hypothetical protein